MELKCGPTHALTDAVAAYGALGNPSPWKAFACFCIGKALRLLGRAHQAKAGLEEGYSPFGSHYAGAGGVLLDAAGMGRRRREGLEASRIVDQSRSSGVGGFRVVPSGRPLCYRCHFCVSLGSVRRRGGEPQLRSRGTKRGTHRRSPKCHHGRGPGHPGPGALVLLSDHASARQLLCECVLGSLNYRPWASWPKRQPKPKTSSPLPLPPRRSLTHCRQQRSGVWRYLPTYMTFEEISRESIRLADDRKNSSHRRVPQARCQVAGRGGQEGPATGIALRLLNNPQ